MSNPFCYVELHTEAPKNAIAFYKKVFSWKPAEVPGMGGYSMFRVPEPGVGGGIGPKEDASVPNHWLSYVQVDDVKKTMDKAVKAGAIAVLPFQELPGMGSIGIFMDPQGAALGIWAAAPKPPAPKKAAKKPAKKVAKKPAKKPAKKVAKKAAKKAKKK